MSKELKQLLAQGVVEKCHSKTGFLSRMFLIPKTNGKLRQIFDLRRLNCYLNPRKFRLVNQAQVPNFLQPGDFLGKLDISQAYFHVPIKVSHRRFLAFGYANELFQMSSLPFGLSSAPLAFSRVIKWVGGFRRTKGLRVLVYLDDFLFAHQDPDVLKSQMSYAVGLLQSLGWCVNLEKSVLEATTSIEFLGIVWDTNRNEKRLPEGKIIRLLTDLEKVLQKSQWTWQLGTSLIGRLGFAALVTPLGRLFTRYIQRASLKLSQNQPDRLRVLPPPAVNDCRWWTLNVRVPGKIFHTEPTIFVTTDASDEGWGVQIGVGHLLGKWTKQQATWHINKKELFTVYIALKKCQNAIAGQSVMIQSDNKTVISYLRNQGGTRSMVLLEESRKILLLAESLGVTIHSFYLPGRYNSIADSLSRGKSLPDWHVVNEVTTKVFLKWGTPQIDLFATSRSKVVSTYASIEAWDSQARFINAFSQTWHYKLAWIFPPPPLIPRVLRHLNQSSGTYLLMVPRWETVFWRDDLKRRALEAPFQIRNVNSCLIDLSTDRPLPNAGDLSFEVLEDTGWSELIADMDPGDIDLVQSAWRDSTWRTYQSSWKQWVSWCRQNGKSPSNPRPQDLATYLGYLSRVRKLAASTILVQKSVILTLADPTQEKRLATHPLVSTIVKAIGIKKCASSSSKSRDVHDLLRWLRSHCPNEDSIFQVSRHVALLLLLASGRRIHDLTLLCIDDQHCDRSSSSITFWPKFGSKTDNMKNRQSGWHLSCSEDPALSLVKWVNCLIDLSASRRSARPNLHSLFITTRGEVKAATRAIIAGWIKAPFRDLGINYSPGSIRSAVASSDYQNNVPLDFILKRGNWRGSDNFFKHYCKSLERPRNENLNVLNNSFSAV